MTTTEWVLTLIGVICFAVAALGVRTWWRATPERPAAAWFPDLVSLGLFFVFLAQLIKYYPGH